VGWLTQGWLPDFEMQPHDIPLALLNDNGVVWPV
jgi:hypothetical protein